LPIFNFSRHQLRHKNFNPCIKRKKGEGKKKKGEGKKRCAGKGRKYFQRCWGRFSTMLCLETFPCTLKNEGKGRKKRERGRKKICRQGKKMLVLSLSLFVF